MENFKRIALFIDADNTQSSKLECVMREVSARGHIAVKRAYGNWRKDYLKNWVAELKRFAIKAEQQFDCASGKNATDIALTVDAMNLLHRNLYDAFVIVSSDSDFTPLVINLHEAGAYVIGIGKSDTPESFQKSCDEFLFLEKISGVEEPSAETADAQGDFMVKEILQKGKELAAIENTIRSMTLDSRPPETAREARKTPDIDNIHSLLEDAFEKYRGRDGYAGVSLAGQMIKTIDPDFDPKDFGYPTLSKLLKAFPKRYELKWRHRGRSIIVFYWCREEE